MSFNVNAHDTAKSTGYPALRDVTPLVLTYNEAANIERTLRALAWANEVVVLDSFSDDGTPELAMTFPNVRVVQRRFDQHAKQ